MKIVVRKLDEEQAIIDFETNNGVKTLVINTTTCGYKYDDFSQWDITDEEYYKIEEIVDRIADEMNSEDEVIYDLD